MENPCDNTIDPMDGAEIPDGFSAVSTVVNGEVVWTTNPPSPPVSDSVSFGLQNGGVLLIDEGISLSIQ